MPELKIVKYILYPLLVVVKGYTRFVKKYVHMWVEESVSEHIKYIYIFVLLYERQDLRNYKC